MYEKFLRDLSLQDIYIAQTFSYYQACFDACVWCQSFVAQSSRIPETLRNMKGIGLCDRTIHKAIPASRTLEGGAIRGTLQQCGLITGFGGEFFRGCVVFPTFDEQGRVVKATGYRFGKRIRHWQPVVLHWSRPASDDYVNAGLELAKQVIYAKTN